MPRSDLVQFIYGTGLVSMSSAELIAQRFAAKHINKNEYLLRVGHIADAYLYLEKGYLRSFAADVMGHEVTTAFYAPGQVVFEVASFFNRTRSRENIQALTDCTGWFITYEQLNELFHALPEFREFGRSMLVSGFATLKTRMLSTITETAEERYAALISSNPDIFQHAPLKYIASYLGVTDTSLSRIRAGLFKK